MKFFSQLTLFCFFAILTTAGRGAENPNIGQDAPDLNLDGWATSKTLQQNALDGRPYALEFWATWCPPCRQSIPHLNELSQRMEPFGLRVLGLSEEGLDKVEPFATEMGMTYYVGAGHEMSGLKFDGIPFAAAVGADGKIEWAGHPMDAAFEKTLWKLTRDYAPQTLLPAIEKAEGGALGPAYETLQGIDTEQAKASMKRMRSNLDLRLEQAGTLDGLERYHALSDIQQLYEGVPGTGEVANRMAALMQNPDIKKAVEQERPIRELEGKVEAVRAKAMKMQEKKSREQVMAYYFKELISIFESFVDEHPDHPETPQIRQALEQFRAQAETE